jgi:hypothetical protein
MAEPSPVVALSEHFAGLEDRRVERTKLHPLLSIVVIALCAVRCGAESWDDIAEYGDTKQDWLVTFRELPNGVPYHDTLNRVFAALDPQQLQAWFRRWMQAVATVLPTEVIADGDVVAWLHDEYAWPGLAAIGMVTAERQSGEARTTQCATTC